MALIGEADSIITMLSDRIKELENNYEFLDKKVEYILQTQNKIQEKIQERKE